MKADQIKQGESYTNCFPVDDSFLDIEANDKINNYACTIDVKQYPDDSALITRSITLNAKSQFEFTLTPTETDALDVGLYHIIGTMTKTGKEIEQTIRLTVGKKWA